MFRRLVEEIRLEARSGPYGHYDVDRSKSHFGRLLGGIAKVAGGSLGIGTLGTLSVGDHPGTERDAAEKRRSEQDADRKRKAAEKQRLKSDKDQRDSLAPKKNHSEAPGASGQQK